MPGIGDHDRPESVITMLRNTHEIRSRLAPARIAVAELPDGHDPDQLTDHNLLRVVTLVDGRSVTLRDGRAWAGRGSSRPAGRDR
jgi:hypothetical protein